MSGLIRNGAVIATSAALAFGGVTAPAVAAGHGNNGHHKKWSKAKCEKAFARWHKKHQHLGPKQLAREDQRLGKHGCPVFGATP